MELGEGELSPLVRGHGHQTAVIFGGGHFAVIGGTRNLDCAVQQGYGGFLAVHFRYADDVALGHIGGHRAGYLAADSQQKGHAVPHLEGGQVLYGRGEDFKFLSHHGDARRGRRVGIGALIVAA